MIQIKNNKFTATNIIIVLTIIMFIVQNSIEHGSVLLGLNIFFFKYELYYQLISTMFAHGGFAHILMNMFVLYQFGNMIETHIGIVRFLILYLLGGILTSIGTLIYMNYTEDWANVVGASGAISVLLGWYALRVPVERKAIIIWILLISIAPLFLGLPVAWYAHFIGFAIGWVLGYIL
jgi:membrane associated rhomboid family serine protease